MPQSSLLLFRYFMMSFPRISLLAEGQIPLSAESYLHSGIFSWLTNSIIFALIVTGLIVILARKATAKMSLVPDNTSQNLFESLIEGLYGTLEGIVGPKLVSKVFPLLATFFIFILASNLFGLVPGVGTIGFGEKNGFLSIHEMEMPLLRPANADLNLTLSMAAVFMIFWLIWSLQGLGVGGMIHHIFGVKGEMPGLLKYPLALLFAMVGVIEVISIMFRPVSLSLRLFGNIYAGENLLHTMVHLGDSLPAIPRYLMSVLIPVPFYFLELLVAAVQALVFMLLCAVYIQLMAPHDDEHHDDGKEHAHSAAH